MRSKALALIALLSLAGACDRSNDHPPLVTPNHNCSIDGITPTSGGPPNPNQICVPHDAGFGCACEQYGGAYPPDTYDSTKAKCRGSMPDGGTCAELSQPTGTGLTGGSGTGLTGGGGPRCTTVACCDDLCAQGQAITQACPNDNACEGCSIVTHFAWPDCAQLAEASGTLVGAGANLGDDDDYDMDMCPLTDASMRRDPFDGFTELRGTGSYTQGHDGEGNVTVGRINVETQDCRLYDGVYNLFNVGGVAVQSFAPRPFIGDLISASGDWIVDDNSGFLHSEHSSWAEIHEAHTLATTRRVVNDTILYSAVTTFFAVNRPNKNILDVKIPTPGQTNNQRQRQGLAPLDKLSCAFDFDPSRIKQSPECLLKAGVTVKTPLADSPNGLCRIEFDHLDPVMSPPIMYGCQETCENKSFTTRFPTDGCKNIFFSGALRSEWTDPADLWVCNCPCKDPSDPTGAGFITAPVQGCAPAGLSPSQQQQACAAVCGGLFCGASGACVVNECQAPQSGATAHLVAQGVCDPDKPQPLVRVATAGDYRVVLDDKVSTVTFHVEGTTSTQPATGTFFLNPRLDPGGGVLEFASAQSTMPPQFTVSNQTVKDAVIVTAERLFAQLLPDQTSFRITAGDGVFAVRGMVNGQLKGQNVRNPEAIGGSIQLQKNGRFIMDLHAVDPSPEANGDNLDAHLEGTVDNVPPLAVSGGPTRQVECLRNSAGLTTVVLDGRGSSDPDPGDSISHYQWFTTRSEPVSNQATATVALPLGTASYVLHVYDQKLGAAQSLLDVTVADTTPPALTVSPAAFCMWPPNHRRVRFALSAFNPQTTDACDPAPDVRIVSVTSNEADNGLGDGDTQGDVAFSAGAFCVRRERSGTGSGRVYTVMVESRDHSGNATRKPITVTIPHDQKGDCATLAGSEISDGAPCQ
jgi:hypothetical protein